jgi:hypothetical protein
MVANQLPSLPVRSLLISRLRSHLHFASATIRCWRYNAPGTMRLDSVALGREKKGRDDSDGAAGEGDDKISRRAEINRNIYI